MKKKHFGATKKTRATEFVFPWRTMAIFSGTIATILLVIWAYPKGREFYLAHKTKLSSQPVVVAVAPEEAPTFEFYTELTKQEVDNYYNNAKNSTLSLKKNSASAYNCYVQAGSYSKMADAERTKAFLTLNGYSASVKSVTLEDGKMRHRIILGPFVSINEAQDMQRNLQTLASIESVLVKSA
jgi:cell division protein FtsN